MLLIDARVGGRLVDIAVDGGRIASVVPAGTDRSGETLALGGRVVIPGLWDEHVHLGQWASGRQRIDVSTATSAAEAADRIRAAVAGTTELPLVVGYGFRDGLWPDAPTAELLDDAAGSVPTVLISADIHAVWLNSAALRRFDHSDHPTGLLREDPAFAVTRALGAVGDDVLDGWVLEAAAAAASRGVVGVVDLEMDWNAGAWRRRRHAGFDSLRVEFGVYRQHLDRAIDERMRSGDALDELVTVGPFKILTDGSLNTRTAYCYDPYPGVDGPDAHGLLTVPPEELLPLLVKATNAGFAPAVHAIGDRANALALDALAQAGPLDRFGVHARMEHAQLLAVEDLPRFAELGLVASVQPDHAMDDRDVAEHHWAGRTDRAFALRSLLDAGARLTFGSDAPVSPLDPWNTMAAAVGRSRDGREPWHPEQRVTVDEALAASTRTTIAPGQPADLVVLDGDPWAASVEELRRMPVAATMLAGRFTYKALAD